MAQGDIWQCTADSGLKIRSNPNTSSTSVGALSKGETVVEITQSNGWLKHSRGWSSMEWLVFYKAAPTPTTVTENNNSTNIPDNYYEESGMNSDGSGYTPDTDTIYDRWASNSFESTITNPKTFNDL